MVDRKLFVDGSGRDPRGARDTAAGGPNKIADASIGVLILDVLGLWIAILTQNAGFQNRCFKNPGAARMREHAAGEQEVPGSRDSRVVFIAVSQFLAISGKWPLVRLRAYYNLKLMPMAISPQQPLSHS